MKTNTNPKLMEAISNLAKRRGFVYPSGEIYGGLNGFWDYGPLGVELKNNIKKLWWDRNVREREDVVGIEASIITNPKVWHASGHIGHFNDPMIECKQCHARFREDRFPLNPPQNDTDKEWLERWADSYRSVHGMNDQNDLTKAVRAQSESYSQQKVVCPSCLKTSEFTEAKPFNLMFKTFIGPTANEEDVAYLRPETAQGMFVNFRNVLDSSRLKVPFGIAQIGKSFRNEITTGNFIFRNREFEQMELEYFVKPGEEGKWHEYWKKERLQWYLDLGIKTENIRLRDYDQSELAHYSKATADVEYNYPFMGWGELEGVASRSDYDLKRHLEASGRDLTFFDEETKEKFVPFVVEPAAGVDRVFLILLLDAYFEEEDKDGTRIVLRFHPKVAPVKVAIFPLQKDDGIVAVARDIYSTLRGLWSVQYDQSGSVGRRYRRQDEIGTPYCVTVDFDTLTDKKVTVRDRDTMAQERVAITDLPSYFSKKLN